MPPLDRALLPELRDHRWEAHNGAVATGATRIGECDSLPRRHHAPLRASGARWQLSRAKSYRTAVAGNGAIGNVSLDSKASMRSSDACGSKATTTSGPSVHHGATRHSPLGTRHSHNLTDSRRHSPRDCSAAEHQKHRSYHLTSVDARFHMRSLIAPRVPRPAPREWRARRSFCVSSIPVARQFP